MTPTPGMPGGAPPRPPMPYPYSPAGIRPGDPIPPGYPPPGPMHNGGGYARPMVGHFSSLH